MVWQTFHCMDIFRLRLCYTQNIIDLRQKCNRIYFLQQFESICDLQERSLPLSKSNNRHMLSNSSIRNLIGITARIDRIILICFRLEMSSITFREIDITFQDISKCRIH